MKVKVIKANLPSYWYANNIGKVYDVEEIKLDNHSNLEYKVIGGEFSGTKYFDKDDVEIINEEKGMFDMKKEKWFIRVDNEKQWGAVNNWLEENFGDKISCQYYSDFVGFTNTDSGGNIENYLMWVAERHLKDGDRKEIKLTFKTVVNSVEYPETKSSEQIQLDVLQEKIAELTAEAEKLQGLIKK